MGLLEAAPELPRAAMTAHQLSASAAASTQRQERQERNERQERQERRSKRRLWFLLWLSRSVSDNESSGHPRPAPVRSGNGSLTFELLLLLVRS